MLMYFRGAKKSAGELSLSDTIEGDDEGGSLCLMDVVCTEEDILERISRAELSIKVEELLRLHLDPRERRIICLRYGVGGGEPLPQREVARLCGISRSYVLRRQ